MSKTSKVTKRPGTKAVAGDYKGSPTLQLHHYDEGTGYLTKITFGVRKAELIAECLEDIVAFIAANTKKADKEDAA